MRAWPLGLVGTLLLACGSGATATDDPSATGAAGASAAGAGGAAGAAGSAGKAGAAGKGGGFVTGGSGGSGGASAGAAGTAGAAGSAGAGGKGFACPPDEDLDGISDEIEGKSKGTDTDGDGKPDYQDDDSDADGIPDLIEGQTASNGCSSPQDSDGDGKPDYRDTDSDDNGVPDAKETYPDGSAYSAAKGPPADTDGDKYPDYADPDNDGDSLPDTAELVGGVAVDTDGDGKPDLSDSDSDNDGIHDGQDGTGDFDKDGKPNFRDTDADNDGIPDSCEAGLGFVPGGVPADSDKDAKPDFLDLDSDNDGLLDADEDKNKDCKVQQGETDPRKADTDGDGASDMIEVALGSNPDDVTETPQSLGKFYFIMPYQAPPEPPSAVMAINTKLQRADVGFVFDTTGTMGGQLFALQNAMAQLIPALAQEIPDVAVGVAGHDDVPVSPFGDPGDLPFYIPPTGRVTTQQSDAVAAIKALKIHGGGDLPESQVLAMWRSLTNDTYAYPPGVIVLPESIPTGTFGSLAFRADALPVVISVTDAPFHDGKRSTDPSTFHDTYGFSGQYAPPNVDKLAKEMKDIGARFIGLAANNGIRNADPYYDMAYLADQTGSVVPPSAFGGSKCKTNPTGDLAPDAPGGNCRLVFDLLDNISPSGISSRVTDAIKALLKSLKLDVRVTATSDPLTPENQFTDSIDTFVESIRARAEGGDDPTLPGATCVVLPLGQVRDYWKGPKGALFGGDTVDETFQGIIPTQRVCFDIKVIPNTTIKPLPTVQTFRATLQVKAKVGKFGEVKFGAPRDVLFVIPPTGQ